MPPWEEWPKISETSFAILGHPAMRNNTVSLIILFEQNVCNIFKARASS